MPISPIDVVEVKFRPRYKLDIFRVGSRWSYAAVTMGVIPGNPALIFGLTFPSWLDAEIAAFSALPRPCIVVWRNIDNELFEKGIS